MTSEQIQAEVRFALATGHVQVLVTRGVLTEEEALRVLRRCAAEYDAEIGGLKVAVLLDKYTAQSDV